jgi:hypothetical protein
MIWMPVICIYLLAAIFIASFCGLNATLEEKLKIDDRDSTNKKSGDNSQT